MKARDISNPEPGLFRIRLVKGGPWVAARITHGPARDPVTGESLDRSPMWVGEIAGKPTGPAAPCPHAAGIFQIWERGEPITIAEYRHLCAVKDHADRYAPDMPEANPRRPIDLNLVRPVF